MDPATAVELATKVYQLGGITLVLVMIIVAFAWYSRRDSIRREDRLSTAIEECQRHQVVYGERVATLLVNNTDAMNRNTAAVMNQTEIMRVRPCLKDDTPIKGHQTMFPKPRT